MVFLLLSTSHRRGTRQQLREAETGYLVLMVSSEVCIWTHIYQTPHPDSAPMHTAKRRSPMDDFLRHGVRRDIRLLVVAEHKQELDLYSRAHKTPFSKTGV
jgi:hypothetical protein